MEEEIREERRSTQKRKEKSIRDERII